MIQKLPVLYRPLPKVLFFETTGTLFFVYGIVLSNLPGYPPDIFTSAALFLAICWAGQLTGGHFNPAVTVGVKITSGLNNTWAYIVSQFVGGLLGAFLAYYVSRATIVPQDLPSSKQVIGSVIGELLGTFAFVLSVLIVTSKATSFAKKPLYIYTFIPVSYFICRRLCGGADINPVVATMGSLVNVIFNNGEFKYFWTQAIPPIFGAAFAGLFFKFLCQPMVIYHKVSSKRKSV